MLEPDLRLATRETYRWVYERSFEARVFVFRVIVYENDSAELISKIAAGPGFYQDSIFVQHNGTHFHVKKRLAACLLAATAYGRPISSTA
jgi:hypothetical protein